MQIQSVLLAFATLAATVLAQVTPISPACNTALTGMMNVVSTCKVPTTLKAGDKLTAEQSACICLPANQATIVSTIKECATASDSAASATGLTDQLSESCKSVAAPAASSKSGASSVAAVGLVAGVFAAAML
ncbi:hypothetical protein HDU81_010956 [Chytriomyces hyalinus]|nr:hypothetical protein HDU81_010956 [Chytriomyces hyalinus]